MNYAVRDSLLLFYQQSWFHYFRTGSEAFAELSAKREKDMIDRAKKILFSKLEENNDLQKVEI